MFRNLILLLFITILFNNCHSQSPRVNEVLRDTTISPGTSFSKLFLDSLTLETFIKSNHGKDSSTEKLRNFYKGRNYQFAWFTEDGIAEHTRSFWNLHNNYINYFGDTALKFKLLHKQIDILLDEDSTVRLKESRILLTDMQLTKHFFEYSNNAYAGKVNSDDLQWNIPRKKINAVLLLESLLSREGKNLAAWEPVNLFYKRLKEKLLLYYDINKAGGWKAIQVEKLSTVNPGGFDPLIREIKKRLTISGDFKIQDTSDIYTPQLAIVVKQMQKGFGLAADGVINPPLISQLNKSVKERLNQLLINLERMRWVPEQPTGNFILVNIPEYRLHVFEGTKKSFSMDIVVGKAAHSTVIFTRQLTHVVFSPYWNIPRSIVRNEILPAITRNGNYLATMNMERIGYSEGLPVIRQKPGGANALGRVKFIFPNSYNIYFHDTPSRSLFTKESRAFSHGCIRLAEPEKMATYLLRMQPEWTADKISQAMSASVEKWVPLKNQIPVFITYFTAWVDSEGLLNFRDDIYGHDKKLAKELFKL